MKKKFTMLFAALLACVGVTKAQTVITDVSLLKDDMECTVSTSGRGGWAVNAAGDQFGSTADYGFGTSVNAAEDQHIFQFKTIDGKIYLYSTYAEKFVNKDRNLSEVATEAIEILSSGTAGKFVVKFDESHYVNLGGSNQMTIDGWNTFDAGNMVTITDVTDLRTSSEEYIALVQLVEASEALIAEAEDNVGSAIGEYEQDAINALNSAVSTAKALGKNEVAQSDVDALQEVYYDLVMSALPDEGKYYHIYSSLAAFPETKAVYSDGDAPGWKTLNAGDMSFYWKAVAIGNGQVAFQNENDGKFLQGHEWNEAWTMESESTNAGMSLKVFAKGADESDYEYGIVIGSYQMHAMGHGSGSGTGSYLVGYNTNSANSASSWYIVEVLSPMEQMRASLLELKDAAKDKIDELIALPGTEPVGEVVSTLSAAIASATANENSDDMDVLSAAILNLEEAIAMTKNLEFEGGALATLDEDLYVIYYEDANGDRHYLVNNKNTRRVVTSSVAAVYDVYDGNTDGGYAPFAYFLDMNESKISNPTSGDDKEIQVENKGGGNYAGDRQWDSQVLYVDANGKYAIRSTNCTTGSGWNSDCFITVSYDGTTVYGENTDLSDALYVWNVVKASEADIAFELEVDEYKYMTLFLNYAVIVPSGAKAYAVSAVENSQLILTEVEGIIPMNTPVIIEAEQGDYRFVYTDPIGTYEGENLLKGSWLDSYVAPAAGTDAYVMTLSASGEAVMGKAMLNVNANGEAGTTHFMNRANKAYLEIETAKAAGAAMYSFNRGEGTTSIEDVQLTIDNVVIYDITGRRVEKMEKGIYIVNGKKVFVK